ETEAWGMGCDRCQMTGLCDCRTVTTFVHARSFQVQCGAARLRLLAVERPTESAAEPIDAPLRGDAVRSHAPVALSFRPVGRLLSCRSWIHFGRRRRVVLT